MILYSNRNIFFYFMIVFSYFYVTCEVKSQEDTLSQSIIQKINKFIARSKYNSTEQPLFVSGCYTKNYKYQEYINSYDGRIKYILIIIGDIAELVEIAKDNLFQIGWAEYLHDEKDFYFEAQGGMWSSARSSDIFNNLVESNFKVLGNQVDSVTLYQIASRQKCDIAYVSLNLYVRFYEHVDPWTGETVSVERVPEKRLNESTLAALSNWRNAHGMPWSTTGHATELTVWDQHRHSVRLGVAALLMTVQLWKELLDTIDGVAREEGLSRREWAQRHISEFAGLSDRFLFWESFAWFTGRHYREGALPAPAERLLARMASGAHLADVAADEEGGFWSDETPLAERLPSILQSLETARSSAPPDPAAAERPIAGFDVRYFLDRRKLELQRAGTWTAEEPQ